MAVNYTPPTADALLPVPGIRLGTAAAGIPTGVMTAPIIPGLNSDEIPELIKAAADHGADSRER